MQENHYDPFGLELAGLSQSSPGLKSLNQYSWNSKEKQAEFGLNWHDHGWRFYDPQLGRWVVVDPDAEEADQEGWTTYQFGLNNAVRYNDLDVRKPGPGDDPTDLLTRARSYLANTAKQAVTNALSNAVNNIKKDVQNAVEGLQASVYGKVEVKASGQVGGSAEFKNGLGVNANAAGGEIASFTAEGTKNIKTKEFNGKLDPSYAGKGGEHKETKGGGAALFVGASVEKENTMRGTKVIGTKATTTVSASALPPAGGIQTSVVRENG